MMVLDNHIQQSVSSALAPNASSFISTQSPSLVSGTAFPLTVYTDTFAGSEAVTPSVSEDPLLDLNAANDSTTAFSTATKSDESPPSMPAPAAEPVAAAPKRRGRPKAENSSCSSCGTTKTPHWRLAPGGARMCNACGLRVKSKTTKRNRGDDFGSYSPGVVPPPLPTDRSASLPQNAQSAFSRSSSSAFAHISGPPSVPVGFSLPSQPPSRPSLASLPDANLRATGIRRARAPLHFEMPSSLEGLESAKRPKLVPSGSGLEAYGQLFGPSNGSAFNYHDPVDSWRSPPEVRGEEHSTLFQMPQAASSTGSRAPSASQMNQYQQFANAMAAAAAASYRQNFPSFAAANATNTSGFSNLPNSGLMLNGTAGMQPNSLLSQQQKSLDTAASSTGLGALSMPKSALPSPSNMQFRTSNTPFPPGSLNTVDSAIQMSTQHEMYNPRPNPYLPRGPSQGNRFMIDYLLGHQNSDISSFDTTSSPNSSAFMSRNVLTFGHQQENLSDRQHNHWPMDRQLDDRQTDRNGSSLSRPVQSLGQQEIPLQLKVPNTVQMDPSVHRNFINRFITQADSDRKLFNPQLAPMNLGFRGNSSANQNQATASMYISPKESLSSMHNMLDREYNSLRSILSFGPDSLPSLSSSLYPTVSPVIDDNLRIGIRTEPSMDSSSSLLSTPSGSVRPYPSGLSGANQTFDEYPLTVNKNSEA
eukprot:GILJ01007665.1.p1 GENE.GILJ01007665.1~~GILJ01007665.1.p1  ORF type:complete len:701 (-),score=99.57 GILJ01007665.1:186-2288(-)